MQGTTWANIVDKGKERQVKLMGLHKWGLYLILESLPVMLQFSLLLFGAALVVYLWDLEITVAQVVLVVTSASVVLYASTAAIAVISCGYPFQTPLSVLLSKIPSWAKNSLQLSRVRLRHWLKKRATQLSLLVERFTGHGHLTNSLGRVFKVFAGEKTFQAPPDGDTPNIDYPMTLSNPVFWRHGPLFTSPIPKDIVASAGFWLLENSADFSTTSVVVAAFTEFQLPACHFPVAALTRLRDAYMECFRSHIINKHTRLTAVQSAVAYYVLYHAQLIWNTWNSLGVEVEKLPSDLPPDLFLYLHNDEWNGDDVFEYLLHIDVGDRPESVESAQFLSYIAPYWFCGDSDPAIRFRPSRLQTLSELIEVLEISQALTPATVTNCILCAGAAMDFPLHPEDLIRVDKRCVPLPSYVDDGTDWG